MQTRILAARQAGMSVESARALVANPTPIHSPFLRRLAWDALRAARDEAARANWRSGNNPQGAA